MYSLEGIMKLADNELMSMVEKGQFRSREDVDTAYKLIDVIEDIYCIWKMEDEEGFSNEGGSYEGGSYRGGSYRGGRSNRGSYEGGRSNRGSYEGGRSRNSYRGGGGYSRADYVDELRRIMESAPDEQTRQSVQRMIQQMEQM